MEKRKGLIVEIYKWSLGDCSNDGISSRHTDALLIMDEEDSQVFEEDEKRPVLKIVRRNIFGRPYIHAEPVYDPKKGEVKDWFMAGGAFVYSGDYRFSRYVNPYPISLHDRTETPEEFERLNW